MRLISDLRKELFESMIEKLIEEIRSNRISGSTLSALICALILPDICGKAEYPSEKAGTRYKKWYAEYVGKYEKSSANDCSNDGMPYASADVIYDLRCHLIHQGEPNIDKEKQRITHFRAVNQNDLPKYTAFKTDSGETGLEINVFYFAETLCLVAEAYYKENKERFNLIDGQESDCYSFCF